MTVLFLVLPLALLLVALAVWAYVGSARAGQFDDLDTPAIRLLHDDDPFASGVPAACPRRADPSSKDAPR